MSDELLLKINADVKDVTQAYSDIKSKTEDLDASLTKIAQVSAVAFAALSAQVFIAVKEFAQADTASRALSAALQNQGIFTEQLKTKYGEYADAVERTTGIQADEIISAQAVAQSFLGQMPITEKLTKAMADLSVQQGISLPAAAEMLGKAIGNGSGQLLRMGVQFAATDTEAQRYQKTLDFVTIKAGDFATNGISPINLSMKKLETAFKNSQQELGERFAPAVIIVVDALTKFLTPAKESTGYLTDLKAIAVVAGLAVSGLGIVLPIAAQGFLTVRAALAAMNITLNVTRLALAGLGIGLVIAILADLALNFDVRSKQIVGFVKSMATIVSDLFSAMSTTIHGALMALSGGGLDGIKAGLKEMREAFTKETVATGDAVTAAVKKSGEVQDTIKQDLANREAAKKRQHDADVLALTNANQEAIIMELNNSSKKQIDIQKKKIEVLTALEKSENPKEIKLLRLKLKQIEDIQKNQQKQDAIRNAEFRQSELAAQKQADQETLAAAQDIDQQEIAEIRSKQMTKKEAKQAAYKEELEQDVEAHNTFLIEQEKYGTAYASINKVMHSQEVQGLNKATGELVQLTQSKNATLKGIGKAAAVAQITIKTAESAMSIFNGFSAIPIVGLPLGIAGAAAAIVFGAEKISDVMSAAHGGMVTGGIAGRDSVPAMLMPGELVVPKQNFNEVISSVSDSRSGGGKQDSSGGYARVELSLKGNLMDFIEAKIIQRKNLGISMQGSS